jgi:hypothetical protein
MRAFLTGFCLTALMATSAWAQNAQPQVRIDSTNHVPEATGPDYTAVYCSSFVSDEKIPDTSYLVSGEESNSKIVFAQGDVVYINQGSSQGVKVGDRFDVIRPEKDFTAVQWFKWQDKLLRAMGTIYRDKGQLRVIGVTPNMATAIVSQSCEYMQHGDIVRALAERPAPPYKPSAAFDHFAPVSGKSVGMLVAGQDFSQLFGKNSIVYVNLGNSQGVKTGDYLRIFRYQGSHAETTPYLDNYQYKILGFGSTPVKYEWNDIPREVLGEGIVINTSRNSCTIFVTYSRIELFAGDYVEIE